MSYNIFGGDMFTYFNNWNGDFIMSTNSLVAYLREDGSVVSSYVHWDGYTTSVGLTLLENYNSEESASSLATELGYASSLRETIEASLEDRANSDEAVEHSSFAEFESYVRDNSYIEYAYIWRNGTWNVGSYTSEKIGTGRFAEYNYNWNGWEDLTTVFVREGYAEINRINNNSSLSSEYREWASELSDMVMSWDRVVSSRIGNELATL